MKKTYTLVLCILFLLTASFAYSQCADSSNIYTFNYSGKKYEIVKEMKSWTAAAACAAERGGYLIEINDADEQDTLFNAIIKGAKISLTYTQVMDGGGIAYLWIGATDKTTEGTWMWDGKNTGAGTNFWNGQGAAGTGGGSAVGGKYVNWGGSSKGTPNEPDDYGSSQDGGAIALDEWPLGSGALGSEAEWNDINITNSLYYIIEIDKTTGLKQDTEKSGNICVMPNPASNSVQLSINMPLRNPVQIRIIDVTGKEMMAISDSNPVGDNYIKNIDTSGLQNGTYFLIVDTGNTIENSKFSIVR